MIATKGMRPGHAGAPRHDPACWTCADALFAGSQGGGTFTEPRLTIEADGGVRASIPGPGDQDQGRMRWEILHFSSRRRDAEGAEGAEGAEAVLEEEES